MSTDKITTAPNNLTVETVRPENFQNFDFRKNDLDSPRSLNLGIVAGNAVRACQLTGAWDFTIGEYMQMDDEFLGIEEDLLNELVTMGLLSCDGDGIYRMLDAFFRFFPPR
jgi:hypothetical protein